MNANGAILPTHVPFSMQNIAMEMQQHHITETIYVVYVEQTGIDEDDDTGEALTGTDVKFAYTRMNYVNGRINGDGTYNYVTLNLEGDQLMDMHIYHITRAIDNIENAVFPNNINVQIFDCTWSSQFFQSFFTGITYNRDYLYDTKFSSNGHTMIYSDWNFCDNLIRHSEEDLAEYLQEHPDAF